MLVRPRPRAANVARWTGRQPAEPFRERTRRKAASAREGCRRRRRASPGGVHHSADLGVGVEAPQEFLRPPEEPPTSAAGRTLGFMISRFQKHPAGRLQQTKGVQVAQPNSRVRSSNPGAARGGGRHLSALVLADLSKLQGYGLVAVPRLAAHRLRLGGTAPDCTPRPRRSSRAEAKAPPGATFRQQAALRRRRVCWCIRVPAGGGGAALDGGSAGRGRAGACSRTFAFEMTFFTKLSLSPGAPVSPFLHRFRCATRSRKTTLQHEGMQPTHRKLFPSCYCSSRSP